MNAALSAPSNRWFILYRGPLSSCNYACGYCPFAKTKNTRAELDYDAACLSRFTDWVATRSEQIGILFTPWGEAMHHLHYQEAMRRLSHLPNVWRVAAQTNLSFAPDKLQDCHRDSTALWTTYHPTETTIPRFIAKSLSLSEIGIRHSVGVVGRKEAFEDIRSLRAKLPPEIYLWINAWKREVDYYNHEEMAELRDIDPYFDFNAHPHPSLGLACRSGHLAFTVDGQGDMRRCHFIKDIISNIYEPGFENALRPRTCSISQCRCHIGYVHLNHLKMDTIFGESLLERIPTKWEMP
ncbi:MAG: STM4011 family radical SAM protein [Prosthecobacter sp.]|nr:STM4011 family radical SAM protein [Prosthecobacter sp.]